MGCRLWEQYSAEWTDRGCDEEPDNIAEKQGEGGSRQGEAGRVRQAG